MSKSQNISYWWSASIGETGASFHFNNIASDLRSFHISWPESHIHKKHNKQGKAAAHKIADSLKQSAD